MEYKVEEVWYKSSNKRYNVYAKIYIPKCSPKGIIQFSHGMCEYTGKYLEFFEFLLSNGYVVCGNDHIGHGKSIRSDNDLGYFGESDGYNYLIEDLYLMTKIIKAKYSNLKIFLMGHSMGSFIARNYAQKYGNKINGLILCGTIGPQWMIDAGIQMADMIIQKKGTRYRSRKLNSLSFDFANIEFEPSKTKYDWICSDEEVVKKHAESKRNSFIYTVGGFKDLFYLIKNCNDEKKIKSTPKDLPIYIFSGDKDPIGDNGIGVEKVYEMYKKIGVKDVTLKLYKDCRHEMLNEKNKLEVYNDILNFIEIVRFGEE